MSGRMVRSSQNVRKGRGFGRRQLRKLLDVLAFPMVQLLRNIRFHTLSTITLRTLALRTACDSARSLLTRRMGTPA